MAERWRRVALCAMRFMQGLMAVGAAALCGCAGDRFTEFEAPYRAPLASPGAKFAGMPPTVQNTVRAQAGTAVIQDIEKKTIKGRAVYRITFQQQGLYPPLLVAADGSVLNYDLSVAVGAPQDVGGVLTGAAARLPLREVPDNVMRTVRSRTPDAAIESVNREVWGTRTIYIVTFTDPKQPKLYIEPDGTLRNLTPEP